MLADQYRDRDEHEQVETEHESVTIEFQHVRRSLFVVDLLDRLWRGP
jgi:hypothetical protein